MRSIRARVATDLDVMVYLNDVEAGGETRFFAIDHAFGPVKGTAVIWNNLHADGTVNPDTLHAGMPVLAGHKIIITKWFRERGLGPMRYEDAPEEHAARGATERHRQGGAALASD